MEQSVTMTITERLMQIRAALKDRHDGQANALYLIEQLITEQHLNALYPEAVVEGVYTDTMGRLKVKPIEQSNECVHLCSCCKVIE